MNSERIYVIIRETGEYSDRDWMTVCYVKTEDEAKAAIERVTIEQQQAVLPRYPSTESAWGHRLPDGSYFEGNWRDRPENAVWERKPNGDELEAIAEAAKQKYYEECRALGHVDPDGAQQGATYSYESVDILPNGQCR